MPPVGITPNDFTPRFGELSTKPGFLWTSCPIPAPGMRPAEKRGVFTRPREAGHAKAPRNIRGALDKGGRPPCYSSLPQGNLESDELEGLDPEAAGASLHHEPGSILVLLQQVA